MDVDVGEYRMDPSNMKVVQLEQKLLTLEESMLNLVARSDIVLWK